MIRAIYIVAEGQTEEEFVRSLIQPHFVSKHNFYDVRAIKMETSPGHKGGDVSFGRYRKNVELLLKQERDIVVTSLIDFYKLRTDFPKYKESKKQKEVKDRVIYLENACAEVIGHDRFIPYIQLHEFEALLFSSKRGFDAYFSGLSKSNVVELEEIFKQYPNPEMINDSDTTAPSKRLVRLIPDYQKVLYGNTIALENGFQVILDKCPRFSAWIMLLESKIQSDE